jgi:universal stress protein A
MGTTKEVEMKRIVIGYDATPEAERALERAGELARAFAAEVIVTSIAPMLTAAGRSVGPYDPTDPPSAHRAQLELAHATLERFGVDAEVVPGLGTAAPAIVELAEEREADLIVVGGRHLNALERLLGGSVSDGVAHRAGCDVLIVH